jgi:hypothetical protein
MNGLGGAVLVIGGILLLILWELRTTTTEIRELRKAVNLVYMLLSKSPNA